MNWVAKLGVGEVFKEAAQKHLRKYRSTLEAARRDKATLSQQVKSQRKQLFFMRRDVFVAQVLE
eukprot:3890970-Pyramimonas_sp.AAC.1